jgi:hypothetical protein
MGFLLIKRAQQPDRAGDFGFFRLREAAPGAASGTAN